MEKIPNNPELNDKDNARILYEQGAEEWKKGNRAKAITLYSRSASLDPEGPGSLALKMTRDIMDFYDKNQLNP